MRPTSGDRQFKPGQRIRIKLSGGRIAEATIRAVVEHTDGLRLQVDFPYNDALFQVREDILGWLPP